VLTTQSNEGKEGGLSRGVCSMQPRVRVSRLASRVADNNWQLDKNTQHKHKQTNKHKQESAAQYKQTNERTEAAGRAGYGVCTAH
jgi:hypothetical protein